MKPTPAFDRPVLIGHRPTWECWWAVRMMIFIGLCTATLLPAQSLDLDSFNTTNKIRYLQRDSSVITDLHRARVLADQAKEAEQLLLARKNLGGYYTLFQKFDSAKFHLDAGMKIELKDSMIASRASLYINSGILAWEMGFKTTAYQHYLNSMYICEYLGDSLKKAKVLLNLASIDNAFDRFELAIKRLEQAIRLGGPSTNWYTSALNNLGAIYYTHGDTAQAEEYYFTSIETARANNDYVILSRSLANLGRLELEAKNYQEAERLINEALKLSKDNHFGESVVDCHSKLGDLYRAQSQYSKAIEQYDKALNHHSWNTKDADALYTMHHLAFSLKENRRFDEAFDYLNEWFRLNDSLRNSDQLHRIEDLEQQHEETIALMERKRLEEERLRIATERSRRRNSLQYSGILMVLMAFMTVLLFSGKFKLPMNVVEGGIFFTLLILFEFLLVLLDPFIAKYAGGEPAYSLLINSGLALLILLFHGFFEKLLKKRLQKTRD